jgi:hypothetical protein
MLQYMAKHLWPWDPPRGEVCLRVAVSVFCGVSLSVASINVVPSSVSLLLGILVPTFSFAVPAVYFSVGLVFPFLTGASILAFVAATMLLAAATVSDVLFVFIFVAYTFLIMEFNFGKDYALPAKAANAIAAITGSLAITFRTLVQDVFSVTLPTPDTEGDYYHLVKVALTQTCLERDLPEDCWSDSLPVSTFPVTILDDSSDMFGGSSHRITTSVCRVLLLLPKTMKLPIRRSM